MSNFSPLTGTASNDFRRWRKANSTNTTAFAVLAASSTAPSLDGTGYIQTTTPQGSDLLTGTGILRRIGDYVFGSTVARNIVQVRFLGVGSENGTANWKLTGVNRSLWYGAAGTTTPPTVIYVPTPLDLGTFTLGTKATGTGVATEVYADFIGFNTTTGKGARTQVWSGDVATALLANDVASMEVDFTGFEYLLMEFDIDANVTSMNAEYRFF